MPFAATTFVSPSFGLTFDGLGGWRSVKGLWWDGAVKQWGNVLVRAGALLARELVTLAVHFTSTGMKCVFFLLFWVAANHWRGCW